MRKRRLLLRERMEPLVAHLTCAATSNRSTSNPGIWIGPISLFRSAAREVANGFVAAAHLRACSLAVADVDERSRRIGEQIVVREAVRDARVCVAGVVPAEPSSRAGSEPAASDSPGVCPQFAYMS